MINRNEPFPYKLYVKELETELAVAETPSTKPRNHFKPTEIITMIFRITFLSFKISS